MSDAVTMQESDTTDTATGERTFTIQVERQGRTITYAMTCDGFWPPEQVEREMMRFRQMIHTRVLA